MTPEELRAAGRLGTQVYAATVSNIEQAHRRIAAGVVDVRRRM